MPWCEDCTKFWSPNSLPETGKCPGCGLQIAEPQELADAGDYRGYYENVRDAILGKAALVVTPQAALRVMRVLELAVQSSQERRVVEFPE